MSWSLKFTYKSYVTFFPTVIALGYVWIYICFMNCSDKTFYVKGLVNKCFYWVTTLCIPNVYLYNYYIRSWRNFNYSWFGDNLNIIKHMSHFDDIFYKVSINRSVHTFHKIWNTRILRYNFDCGKHTICILLAFIELWFFIYDLITKRLEGQVTWFEFTLRSWWSEQMKLMKLLDLISLRAQFMFETYLPEAFIKIEILLLPMETIIYFCENLLVVMLICGLGLLKLLIVLWTSFTFFFDNWGKCSLIFRISLILAKDACI